MLTAMRRLFIVSVAAGGGYAAWSWYQQRNRALPSEAPEWPALEPPSDPSTAPTFGSDPEPPSGDPLGTSFPPRHDGADPAPAAEPAPDRATATSTPPADDPEAPSGDPLTRAFASVADDAGSTWVPPVDGECPDGYPVKANDNSGIYHVPGGRFYDRTVPERCYARADDAEADGYRASKA